MLENISTILRDQCQLDPHKPLLVGVSGGPDSLCLMDVLHKVGLQIIVAHFNHKLRREADAEAEAVGDTAARLAIPCVIETADVRLHASQEKLSIEEAARDLRYRFLFAQARHHDAQAVAVGHTADDQVETVLMHFMRGAGLNGLRGMAYRTFLPALNDEIPIIRPLLEIWREQVIDYCAAHDLNPHFDASNDSLDFLRNRVRHKLIPMLETYNPRFREAVLRSAHTLSADYALLTQWLDSSWKKCVIQETDDYVALDLHFLSEHPPAQQRHLIRRAVLRLRPLQESDFAGLERAAAFIMDSKCRRMDLIGGLSLSREGRTIYLAKPDAQLPSRDWPQMPASEDAITISVPGQTALSGGWQFSSDKYQSAESAWKEFSRNQDRFEVWLDGDSLPIGLELRVRRSGDTMAPLGLGGHSQKLSDLFTNAKLPQRARKYWPLLCSNDIVIWVPGFRPSEAFKLTKRTRNIVHFELRLPGKTRN